MHDLIGKMSAMDAPVLLGAVARAIVRYAEHRTVRARRSETLCRYNKLTPREREVFAHLINGQLNKQVGFDPGISERTIKDPSAPGAREDGG